MQFARAGRHAEMAQELLARGQAYYCYCSPEELAQMREEARAAGKPPRYDGRWRDRDPAEAPAGVAPVIRIKAPESVALMASPTPGMRPMTASRPKRIFVPGTLKRSSNKLARNSRSLSKAGG